MVKARGLEVWGHPKLHVEFRGQPKINETLLSKNKRGKKRRQKKIKTQKYIKIKK